MDLKDKITQIQARATTEIMQCTFTYNRMKASVKAFNQQESEIEERPTKVIVKISNIFRENLKRLYKFI